MAAKRTMTGAGGDADGPGPTPISRRAFLGGAAPSRAAAAHTWVTRYTNPDGQAPPVFRKLKCNHCNEPACATACPAHAYLKTPEGAVAYNADLCFGCRYRMIVCPFHVPACGFEG